MTKKLGKTQNPTPIPPNPFESLRSKIGPKETLKYIEPKHYFGKYLKIRSKMKRVNKNVRL